MIAEKSELAHSHSGSELTEPTLNRKAVALISGGLDSALSISLVKRQGIEITAVHFTSFFSPLDTDDENSPVRAMAGQLDVPLIFQPKGRDFLDLIRNPRYGHGKNLNPCIDCRIYTLIKARQLMEEIGATFLITGEVAGQRPMSQRKDTIRLIEKRSGCDGIIVRPLSAKALPASLPEQLGIVDRDRFLDIVGRGRKVQLKLAEELGLHGYSTPAGGCLLTDKIFSRRLRDLLDDTAVPSTADLNLLHFGRHIRLRPGFKIVVSRNERENLRLESAESTGSLFYPVDFPGPSVLVSGQPEPEDEILIGSIVRRYSKEATRGDRIGIRGNSSEREITVTGTASNDWIQDHMI